MKILLCCAFYYPSVGGVQVVMQQLAERFAAKGHSVIVATSQLLARKEFLLNGVEIKEFNVSGNFTSGMHGRISQYQDFVVSGGFDVVMIKAAQQWTFDALWPVLDKIHSAKVFIPCGFSCLYEPSYAEYFQRLPDVLRKFDHLIFYASDYRDINFSKEHGMTHYSIIPNGASELEFNVQPDPRFCASLGINESDILFLTVGSLTGLKGHLEIAKAFNSANFHGRNATLILNGKKCVQMHTGFGEALRKAWGIMRLYGITYLFRCTLKIMLRSLGIKVGKEDEFETALAQIRKQPGKTVMVTDLPRVTLVQAFMAADLFVFASNVEYSPLVLYESAAAGTPFLTVPVGNSEEIARWTGGGVVCPAERDAKGYTRVDSSVLARHMENLVQQPDLLKKLGATGKKNWQEKFTWEKIADQYEAIFKHLMSERMAK